MSRSPAPSKSSRSPFSPPANEDLSSTNSSNTSSSRLQTASRPRTSLSNVSNTQIYSGNSSLGRIVHDYSGSETEREPEAPREYGHNYSSSDSMSATPTTSYSEARSIVSETTSQSRFIRRRLSAPAPPEKVLNSSTSTVTRDSTTESIRSRERSRERSRAGDRSRAASRAASRGPSPGPSRTPRKRISTLSVRDSRYDDDGEEADRDDITSAALAAVASSRRSPTGSRRSRGTPPKEFKETEGRSMDLRVRIDTWLEFLCTILTIYRNLLPLLETETENEHNVARLHHVPLERLIPVTHPLVNMHARLLFVRSLADIRLDGFPKICQLRTATR